MSYVQGTERGTFELYARTEWSDVTKAMVIYDRHFVGITWHNVLRWGAQISRVIRI